MGVGLLVWKVPGGAAVLNLLIAHATVLWWALKLMQMRMSPEEEKKDLQKDLERFMQLHNIDSIEKVMAMQPAELLKMDGFGYRLLNYLMDLKENR